MNRSEAESWTDEAPPPAEDDAIRAAIAEGLARARRGEFATEEEVEAAYRRFRE
jgi:hypothetical protein